MPSRLRRLLFGAPKDVHSQKTFHSLSLVAMLAWVGLGADDVGTWVDPVQRLKIGIDIAAICLLMILNVRGVKESVKSILPIFVLFVLTHAILLIVAIGGSVGQLGETWRHTSQNISATT